MGYVDRDEPVFDELVASQRRIERRGTAGCVAAYALLATIALYWATLSPWSAAVALVLTIAYITLISVWGHGSIIEMGVLMMIVLFFATILALQIHNLGNRKPSESDHSSVGEQPTSGRRSIVSSFDFPVVYEGFNLTQRGRKIAARSPCFFRFVGSRNKIRDDSTSLASFTAATATLPVGRITAK
jgi:hypothetical protein